MACTRSNNSLGKKTAKQLQALLKRVTEVYPGATFIVLVAENNSVIDYYSSKSALELKKQRETLENMLNIVASMRHNALDFGLLIKQRNIQPIVTVRGAQHAFLCFPVGPDKLLSFYVDAPFDQSLQAPTRLTAANNAANTATADTGTTSNASGAVSTTGNSEDAVGDSSDAMEAICQELQKLCAGIDVR